MQQREVNAYCTYMCANSVTVYRGSNISPTAAAVFGHQVCDTPLCNWQICEEAAKSNIYTDVAFILSVIHAILDFGGIWILKKIFHHFNGQEKVDDFVN